MNTETWQRIDDDGLWPLRHDREDLYVYRWWTDETRSEVVQICSPYPTLPDDMARELALCEMALDVLGLEVGMRAVTGGYGWPLGSGFANNKRHQCDALWFFGALHDLEYFRQMLPALIAMRELRKPDQRIESLTYGDKPFLGSSR